MISCHVAQRVSILVCTAVHRNVVQLPGLHMVILVRVRRKGQVGSGCYGDRAAVAARCCHCTIFRSFRRIRYRITLRIRHTDCLNVVGIYRSIRSLSVGNLPFEGICRCRCIPHPVHSPVVKLVTVFGGCCEGNVRAAANVSLVAIIPGSRNRSVCTSPSNRILYLLEAHGDGRALCPFSSVGIGVTGSVSNHSTVDFPLLHFIAHIRLCRHSDRSAAVQGKSVGEINSLVPYLYAFNDTVIILCVKRKFVAKRRKLNRHLSIFRRP